MGLEEEEEDEKRELLQPSFLEVACRSSGKLRRFAAGTEAGFASNLINRKLGTGTQPSLYIEAVKEGEEPVSFGPNSVLVNYGVGWKLQTVLAEDYEEGKRVQPNTKQFPPSKVYSFTPFALRVHLCSRISAERHGKFGHFSMFGAATFHDSTFPWKSVSNLNFFDCGKGDSEIHVYMKIKSISSDNLCCLNSEVEVVFFFFVE